MGKSFLAVLSGFAAMTIVVAILTVVEQKLLIPPELLHATPPQPTQAYLVANVLSSLGGAVLGGWLTGRLAPRSPLAHAAALAVVVLVLAAGDMISTSGSAPNGQPGWYGPAIAAVGVAGAIAGGWLVARQRKE